MNPVMAVARRELKTFFASPIAYIVLGGFLLLRVRNKSQRIQG